MDIMKRIIYCKKVEDFSGHSIRIKWVTITQFLHIEVHLKVSQRRKMDPSSDLKIWYQIDQFNTFITSPSKGLVAVNLGIALMYHDNFGINTLLMT